MRAATDFLMKSNPMAHKQRGMKIAAHYSMCTMMAAVLKSSSLAQEPRVCAAWLKSEVLAEWHKAANIVFTDLLTWTQKAEKHYEVRARGVRI